MLHHIPTKKKQSGKFDFVKMRGQQVYLGCEDIEKEEKVDFHQI